MGAVNQAVQAVSDTVSHVGQVVASSPIAQAAVTVGGAMLGVPPAVTAAVLGANQTSQTGGNIGQGLLTGGLSYLGGTAANNYATTGNVFGQGGLGGLLGTAPGSTPAGYTLTGDAIADMSVLKDMGYTGTQAAGIINSGTAGAMISAPGFLSGLGGAIQNGANVISGMMGGGGTASGGAPNSFDMGRMISMGAGLAGSYLNNQAAADAASKQADAQIRAAQIAADAAKFRPVGVTTNFGSSNFGYDANGNLTSAGYTLSPQLQAQQNQIMQSTGGLLNQFTGAKAATAPMGDAAQRAMMLGQGYLTADPVAQAKKFMADQQAVLAAGDATQLANLRANLAATGRAGLMTGGDAGQLAANPEAAAYYNSIAQRNLQLAANATQGGMDYAKFGLGTVGSGGDLLSSMYKTQAGAATPYNTALDMAQGIEGLGQGAMNLGTSIGAQTSTGAMQGGQAMMSGMTNAANTIGTQAQQAGSPWGNLLQGGAGMLQNYRFGA